MKTYKKKKAPPSWITITGAREHNLKNIDVVIPKNQLTIITGPSGSGKSSLALDILYTEGKRRYMESLSSYARQFLGVAKKPDVDRIDGLCPAIAIEQKTVGHNPRSTVGTITEIYDYLRVLYARIGQAHCPTCCVPITQESPDSITEMLCSAFAEQTITIAAPLVVEKKGEFVHELLALFQQGFYRFVIDGRAYRFTRPDEIRNLKLGKTYKHTIDLMLDAVTVEMGERARLHEAVETAFKHGNGTCKVIVGDKQHLYSSQHMCLRCALSFPEIEPRFFSFNSPIGACKECNGLGTQQMWGDVRSGDFFAMNERACRSCRGDRLNQYALSVVVGEKNIMQVCTLSVADAQQFFTSIVIPESKRPIAEPVLKEICSRLGFLNDVGLGYLSLQRTARTLSGGEGQRIRLATQIGSALTGVLYILDEPSIGLHQRDNDRLIGTLKALRDQGNTVVVVEHDIDTMQQADYLVDMGPAAGVQGGMITAAGSPQEVAGNSASLTGAYLAGTKYIAVPQQRRKPVGMLTMSHVRMNNLKDLSVNFPLGVLCCVSGVSGSGKSTLVVDELVSRLTREIGYSSRSRSQGHDNDLKGAEQLASLVVIDQSPIGRTPRSNPATYLKVFDEVRKLYARLPESNMRGYAVGRFSFNVAEGRCFECKGDGSVTVSMQFLPDVVMACKACKGKRYNSETLAIRYKGKTIADVLDMTAYEALSFFATHRTIAKRLALLCDVGLDYLKLGQPSTTLSGGEAQRIKLVDELAKRGSSTLYVLDEPTTGLHTSDIEKLLQVLNRLVDKGNSMIIIEHNLDVLKTADHLIDLGPEGGDAGGQIVAHGTPEEVAQNAASYTGRYLKAVL